MSIAHDSGAARGRFDAFLYTIIDADGAAPLSVLSLLARADVDPWAEAAFLAAQTREVAAGAMTKFIARLPARSATHAESSTLAARLIALLPGAPLAAASPTAAAVAASARQWSARSVFAYTMVAILILCANWGVYVATR